MTIEDDIKQIRADLEASQRLVFRELGSEWKPEYLETYPSLVALRRIEAELARLHEENEDLLRGSGGRELSLAVDLHETKREFARLREALDFTSDALYRVLTQGPHPDGRDMRTYERAHNALKETT